MKNLVLLCCMGFILNAHAQERYLTRAGQINFEASVPSFEPVAAESNSATAILDPATGEVAALVLVKAFRFENALMEEHFNENYAESSQYPKAKFEGKLEGFSVESLSETPEVFALHGDLFFHGVTKSVEIPVKISQKEENILLRADFILSPSDFKIKIPGIVRKKVAKEVNVSIKFKLEKQ